MVPSGGKLHHFQIHICLIEKEERHNGCLRSYTQLKRTHQRTRAHLNEREETGLTMSAISNMAMERERNTCYVFHDVRRCQGTPLPSFPFQYDATRRRNEIVKAPRALNGWTSIQREANPKSSCVTASVYSDTADRRPCMGEKSFRRLIFLFPFYDGENSRGDHH